jgi:hypothetical protein
MGTNLAPFWPCEIAGIAHLIENRSIGVGIHERDLFVRAVVAGGTVGSGSERGYNRWSVPMPKRAEGEDIGRRAFTPEELQRQHSQSVYEDGIANP